MSAPTERLREGSLEAPTRHPLDWRNPDFYNEQSLNQELERVFDICHGCRRCVNLCNAFPTLFGLIDESSTMEIDGGDNKDYVKVVDQCYLCDLCYMTKCPYVPPHEWNVDFPHLMLRAKAIKFKQGNTRFRDRLLTSTDKVGRLASIPVVVQAVNTANKCSAARKVLDKVLGVHPDAILPEYHSDTLRRRMKRRGSPRTMVEPTSRTRGRVVLFTTCYGNYNEPHIGEDLARVFELNGIEVTIPGQEQCCGMPKLEVGDLEAVARAKEANLPVLDRLVTEGWDIVAPVPSCVLMFKQELPMMFPDDLQVKRVRRGIFDPFEYLMLRHKEGKFRTDFKNSLGTIAYHAPCHLRVQNIGMKTRAVLELVPDTRVELIERCSGHDGTYAVKSEFHEASMKICRPIVSRVEKAGADYFSSDCPMAGHQIENGLKRVKQPVHPLSLLRMAYGV